MSSETPHHDPEWLHERYVEQEMSAPEMADEAGVSAQTIYDSMERVGIDRDPTRYGDKSRVRYATYRTDKQGYPRWKAKTSANGEHGRQTESFHVHRLLAIAEHGTNAVEGCHVHHINDIPFDNRPENIEVLEPGEHSRHHQQKLSWLERLAIVEQYRATDASYYDLADVWGVAPDTVGTAVREVRK